MALVAAEWLGVALAITYLSPFMSWTCWLLSSVAAASANPRALPRSRAQFDQMQMPTISCAEVNLVGGAGEGGGGAGGGGVSGGGAGGGVLFTTLLVAGVAAMCMYVHSMCMYVVYCSVYSHARIRAHRAGPRRHARAPTFRRHHRPRLVRRRATQLEG